jgi:hypothetical protein
MTWVESMSPQVSADEVSYLRAELDNFKARSKKQNATNHRSPKPSLNPPTPPDKAVCVCLGMKVLIIVWMFQILVSPWVQQTIKRSLYKRLNLMHWYNFAVYAGIGHGAALPSPPSTVWGVSPFLGHTPLVIHGGLSYFYNSLHSCETLPAGPPAGTLPATHKCLPLHHIYNIRCKGCNFTSNIIYGNMPKGTHGLYIRAATWQIF